MIIKKEQQRKVVIERSWREAIKILIDYDTCRTDEWDHSNQVAAFCSKRKSLIEEEIHE